VASFTTSSSQFVETSLFNYYEESGGVISAATWDGATAYFKAIAGQQWEVSNGNTTYIASTGNDDDDDCTNCKRAQDRKNTPSYAGSLESVAYRGYHVRLANKVYLNVDLPNDDNYETREEASIQTFISYLEGNVFPEDLNKSVGLWYPDRPQNQLEVGSLAGSDKIYQTDNGQATDSHQPLCVMFLVGTTAQVRTEVKLFHQFAPDERHIIAINSEY